MEEKDLKQIKKIVDNSIEVFAEKTVKPGFDDLSNRFDKIKVDVNNLKSDVNNLKSDVRRLPDKDYLDKKIFELKGELNLKIQRNDKRTEIHSKVLKRNNLLKSGEENDLIELKSLSTVV